MGERQTRREKEIERHRGEILDAAERVFAQKGFHTATMEEVSREAEFAIGTLYKFFKGKEDLYAAILDERTSAFERRAREALETGQTARERLRSYIGCRLDIFWENPGFASLFFHETMETRFSIRAGLTPEVKERYESFLADLTKVFRAGIEAGEFCRAKPAILANTLEWIVHGYLGHLANKKQKRNKRDEKFLEELFFRGVLAGPDSNRPGSGKGRSKESYRC